MIILNKEHHLDKLLEHYRISGNTDQAKRRRQAYKVSVVDNEKDLHEALMQREKSWTESYERMKRVRGHAVDVPLAV